jgi:hypothetical protein
LVLQCWFFFWSQPHGSINTFFLIYSWRVFFVDKGTFAHESVREASSGDPW